jgi:formate-dependent nitrite reductase cytochrome c552 subunit
MIAIHTKFICASNSRGSRIKAYTAAHGDFKGFTVTISYPHEFDGVDCHFEAVKALVTKHNLNWPLDNMRYGDSADGRGYSFCFDASSVEKMI